MKKKYEKRRMKWNSEKGGYGRGRKGRKKMMGKKKIQARICYERLMEGKAVKWFKERRLERKAHIFCCTRKLYLEKGEKGCYEKRTIGKAEKDEMEEEWRERQKL